MRAYECANPSGEGSSPWGKAGCGGSECQNALGLAFTSYQLMKSQCPGVITNLLQKTRRGTSGATS